jgi:hypothetical protein
MAKPGLGVVPTIGIQVCEALGLNAEDVSSLDIHINPADGITITARLHPGRQAGDVDGALALIRRFVVTEVEAV